MTALRKTISNMNSPATETQNCCGDASHRRLYTWFWITGYYALCFKHFHLILPIARRNTCLWRMRKGRLQAGRDLSCSLPLPVCLSAQSVLSLEVIHPFSIFLPKTNLLAILLRTAVIRKASSLIGKIGVVQTTWIEVITHYPGWLNFYFRLKITQNIQHEECSVSFCSAPLSVCTRHISLHCQPHSLSLISLTLLHGVGTNASTEKSMWTNNDQKVQWKKAK